MLFILTPSVGVCNCSMFCCTLLYVHFSFANILMMGKRELVALLSLSSWCLVIVVWLFLAVPWDCLKFVIVVYFLTFLTNYFRYFIHPKCLGGFWSVQSMAPAVFHYLIFKPCTL